MKKIIKVICTIIENDQSEILCTVNSDDDIFSNFYGLPGKIIEDGIFIEEHINKYITKTFGYTTRVNSLFSATTYEYDSHILNLIVAKSTILDSISLNNENTKILWVPIENIKNLNWHPALIPSINKLIAKHKRKSISA